MLNSPDKIFVLRKGWWSSYTVMKQGNLPCSSFIPKYSFLSISEYTKWKNHLTFNNLIAMDYLPYAENV